MDIIGLYTNQELLVLEEETRDSEEIIRKLCGRAMKEDCIDGSFVTALLKREESYPTGLPTAIPIAIPHIHDGCLRSFFSMAVLKEPVEFRCMGDPDEKINTRLIFLFGITDPSYQTAVLRKFSDIFQDEETLFELLNMKDSKNLLIKMKEKLEDYLIIDGERGYI